MKLQMRGGGAAKDDKNLWRSRLSMLCDKSASTHVKASQGTALAPTSPWCRFELIESETSETKAKPVEEMYPTCAWFPNFQTQQVQFIYQGWSKMEMSV